MRSTRCNGLGASALVALCALGFPAIAACPTPLGDVNGSSITDISDVQCIVLTALAALSGGPLPGCLVHAERADMDCNQLVSVVDVQIAISVALQLPLSAALDPNGNGCPDSCDPAGPVECPFVPPPAEVSLDPLSAITHSGAVETTTANGFTDDYLMGPSQLIKVGTRRNWGCSLIFFGLTNGSPGTNPTNTIDANDTGREVQIALYDPTRIKQGCAHDASCVTAPQTQCPNSITYLGWNPVQGGNECNHGSPIDGVTVTPGVLECDVRPLHWNPDWQEPSCVNDGCSNPVKAELGTDVRYTQRLRFVDSHIVQMSMEVENLADLAHPMTAQEFPTVYVGFGKNGLGNYRKLLTPSGAEIPIDIPANDGFFYRQFQSDGPWVTLQNDAKDYGVGIYYENRLTEYQGWQQAGVFNNTRAVFPFGLPALGRVRARAYLVLGSFATVAAKMAWLDTALPPFGALDSPVPDAEAWQVLTVAGWALDNKGVTSLSIRVDGQQVAAAGAGLSRPDVCAAYPGYAGCPHVGFSTTISLGGLTPCDHLLEVVATDADGNQRTIAQRRFTANAAPLCTTGTTCDDANPCTTDTCAPTSGCVYTPADPSSLPAESCNGADDDCDGFVDEGAGCVQLLPIHRFFYSSGGDADHAFGTSSASPGPGYTHEGVQFALRAEPAPGWIPLYQVYCAACTDHMLTNTATEGSPSYTNPALLGYCSPTQSANAPLHLRRLWNPASSNHFNSTNPAEWAAAQAQGYSLEGGCWVPQAP